MDPRGSSPASANMYSMDRPRVRGLHLNRGLSMAKRKRDWLSPVGTSCKVSRSGSLRGSGLQRPLCQLQVGDFHCSNDHCVDLPSSCVLSLSKDRLSILQDWA